VFVTLAIGGDVPDGEWAGQVLVTTHGEGERDRRYALEVPRERVAFSTERADLRVGPSSVTVLPDGRYHLRASAPAADGGGDAVEIDVIVAPAPRAYFPGVSLGGDAIVSGYAVPALRADGTGRVCAAGRCERFDGAQAYHDHNWGIWRRVDWEWGAARAGDVTFLYGRVQPTDDVAEPPPLLLYLVDADGFLSLFRPTAVRYEDGRTAMVGGRAVRVPSRAVLADARGADTVRIELEIEHATVTDTRQGFLARGDTATAREIGRPYFVQLKGIARLSGRAAGRVLRGEGTGFFETYR
jgi:hypothetical protein